MQTLPATWSTLHTQQLPARDARITPISDLRVTPPVRAYLERTACAGLWSHQAEAIEAHIRGENVCISTPTASGKTLVFHAAAVERLARDPQATILALYPMKALAQEQGLRWAEALRAAGIDGSVNRIDGNVGSDARAEHCRSSRVIVATPDVIHTWLLTRHGQKRFEGIARFLRKLALVVIDEAHIYSGAFGSNAAFVFRRLQHALHLHRRQTSFIAASATMNDPQHHIEQLVGRPFHVIGAEQDGSPRQPVEIVMAKAETTVDFHSSLATLLGHLRDRGERFIAFFDSRKNTEQMAAILQRGEAEREDGERFDHLLDASILPYKSGYEADHRRVIQERLSNGSLAGVLSTSAMELGLDIPNLHTVVLVGVPISGTSLRQRMGRVGRSGPGRVIVVHGGSLTDDVAFQHPDELLTRPLSSSTIYLENRRIQYLHAMALARPGGEHETVAQLTRQPAATLESSGVAWPPGFLPLCADEREGRVAMELRDMKRDAGEQPTTTFMIRDVEPQFEVMMRRGRDSIQLGTLSFSQVMREAYPGAIYYYTGRSYRVQHVDPRARTILVQRHAAGTTKPVPVHSRLTPQKTAAAGLRFGELYAIETELQLWRAVRGFRETRGGHATQHNYPCTEPVRYSNASFSRTIFTSGVCLVHPTLDQDGVDAEVLTSLLQEAFRLVAPVERQDIDADADTLRVTWGPLSKGRRFLCLFDQASGSLHLTSQLRDPAVLRKVLGHIADLASQRSTVPIGNEHRVVSDLTKAAAQAMFEASKLEPTAMDGDLGPSEEENRVPVFLPRSQGVMSSRPGEVFEIHNIFVHPMAGLSYRGVWLSGDDRVPASVPVEALEAASANVVRGFYDMETGEQIAA